MSDLQLSLIALGAVLVVAVAGYNFVVERRARRRAEQSFRAGHPDALLDPSAERREPVLGTIAAEGGRKDPSLGALDAVVAPVAQAVDEPSAAMPAAAGLADASATLSSRIDTIALVLADRPVTRAQLEPLLDSLQSHATPVHIEGLHGDAWTPVEDSPHDSWRELRVGLQLASRAGPVAEEEIATFNEAVAGFAASVNAISQRETPAEAAARGRALDSFCAATDIEVGVNLIGRAGATFAIANVKALALEQGFAETGSGTFQRRAPDGSVAMTLRLSDGDARRETGYATGLSFALDVPHVANPGAVLVEMGAVAGTFATALGGELVDDARKPLGPNGIALIGRSLDEVVRTMEAQGVPAGGALARRLFA